MNNYNYSEYLIGISEDKDIENKTSIFNHLCGTMCTTFTKKGKKKKKKKERKILNFSHTSKSKI